MSRRKRRILLGTLTPGWSWTKIVVGPESGQSQSLASVQHHDSSTWTHVALARPSTSERNIMTCSSLRPVGTLLLASLLTLALTEAAEAGKHRRSYRRCCVQYRYSQIGCHSTSSCAAPSCCAPSCTTCDGGSVSSSALAPAELMDAPAPTDAAPAEPATDSAPPAPKPEPYAPAPTPAEEKSVQEPKTEAPPNEASTDAKPGDSAEEGAHPAKSGSDNPQDEETTPAEGDKKKSPPPPPMPESQKNN